MESNKNFLRVFEQLGLDPQWVKSDSIYPFAPVFLCNHPKEKLVVKRTRSPVEKARALFGWTRSLANNGIPVVTPSDVLARNPVVYEEQVWVAYPFIEGSVYTGTMDQVRAAGDFLGRMHTSGYTPCEDFSRYSWEKPDLESIDEDREGLQKVVAKYQISNASAVVDRYADLLSRIPQEMATILSVSPVDLPWCCGSWDFKANNLIFQGDMPTLVDPDNAGFLPRVFDLALAVLLFHNEHDEAPARLFTKEEWDAFYQAYAKHVTLTPVEVKNWPIILEFMRLEEGLWLMLNDDEGWAQERQGRFLRELLTTTFTGINL